MLPDFPNGILHLSTSPEPMPDVTAQWLDNPLIAGLCILAMICILASAKSFSFIIPYIFQCLLSGRTNMEIEHRLPIRRSRLITTICIAPVSLLIIFRFDHLDTPWWTLAGAIFLYFGLRRLLYLIIKHKRMNSESWDASKHSAQNSVVLFAIFSVLFLCVSYIFKWGDGFMQVILLVEFGAVFILQIKQFFEIFTLNYTAFSTFLYLCALELIPLGSVIFLLVHFI